MIFCLLFFVSCVYNVNNKHKHQKHFKEKVHCYKVHEVNTDGTDNSDVWLYYYVILMSDNSCYYYTSPTSISDFSKTNWISAKENPIEEIKDEVELPEEEITSEELPETIQSEMDTNPNEFEEATPETEIDVETPDIDVDVDVDAGDGGGGDGGE